MSSLSKWSKYTPCVCPAARRPEVKKLCPAAFHPPPSESYRTRLHRRHFKRKVAGILNVFLRGQKITRLRSMIRCCLRCSWSPPSQMHLPGLVYKALSSNSSSISSIHILIMWFPKCAVVQSMAAAPVDLKHRMKSFVAFLLSLLESDLHPLYGDQ
jgi:hypothetical protein